MKSSSKYPAPIIIEAIRFFGTAVSKLLWQIEFHGTENIPQHSAQGLIVAPNHQTYIDPFWICFPIRRKYRFMAWDKAFDWFLVGDVIRYLGAFPVNLERGTKTALKESLKALNDGAVLIVFPEGTREFSDGKLQPFRSGALKIAMSAKVPVMPVTIRGANKVWAQDMKFPRLGKVEIFYHPIIEIPPIAKGEDEQLHLQKITDELKTIIESKL